MYTVPMSHEDGLRWIVAGQTDISVAESLLSSKHYSSAAFHAQQAAEKSLKGLLRILGYVPWGHNCFNLLQQIGSRLSDPVEQHLLASAQRLDGHYIPSRYPDAFPSGTPADHYDEPIALAAIADARDILKFVQDNKA